MKESKVSETILLLIWTQTLIAVLGSLFYSEVLSYVPCELCWIQRIFMYPLVIIYGVALLKKELKIALPGLVMSCIGFFISLYHYLIQKLPVMQEVGGSCGTIPCDLQYVNYFGFVTIPFLAGTAFMVVIILHLLLLKMSRRN